VRAGALLANALVALVAGALLLTAPAALAQPKGDPQAAARSRAEEGLALFKDGRWEEAYVAFADADRLYHAPTLVAYMGTCRRNQGRLMEAKALYEKVLAEPVPQNAPEAFKKAMDTARSEIEKLRGRIPYLKVKIIGPGAEQAKVTIDGAPAAGAELVAGKAVDPGEHQIAAEAPGASGSVKAQLKEGDAITVEVKLAASASPPPDGQRPPPASPEPAAKGSFVPAGVAFGVGGAGLLVGAITGIAASDRISAAHAGCTAPDASGVRHCPPGNESAASAAKGLIAGSVVGFVVAGAGVIGGVVLAAVRPGGGAKVSIEVGPGSIGLRGRF
jgi:hypothetical protein